jgi:hypothetical protein
MRNATLAMTVALALLGGTLAPGFPFNLPDARGSIALLLDPAGHPVGLYARTLIPPAPPPAR